MKQLLFSSLLFFTLSFFLLFIIKGIICMVKDFFRIFEDDQFVLYANPLKDLLLFDKRINPGFETLVLDDYRFILSILLKMEERLK